MATFHDLVLKTQRLVISHLEAATRQGNCVWLQNAPDAITAFVGDDIYHFFAVHGQGAVLSSRENEFEGADAVRGEFGGLKFLWLKQSKDWARLTALLEKATVNNAEYRLRMERALGKFLSKLRDGPRAPKRKSAKP
jgi:hypothetical protein